MQLTSPDHRMEDHPMESADYVLTNGRLALPDRIATGLSLVVRGGLIRELVPSGAEPTDLPGLDAAGALVSPGLFEFHIHGAGGIGFDHLGSDPVAGAGQLLWLRTFLRARGVTGFLPTMVADLKALENLAEAIEGVEQEANLTEDDLPGIYLEGPFIATTKRGGIPASTIRVPDKGYLAEILAAARGRLRVMTVAPEFPGIGTIIEALREAGVLVSLGHSDCRIEEVTLPKLPFSITHLFNAMSGFSHKDAGLATLPFYDHTPFVELNADTVHVGHSALLASRNALDPDRLILISDAVVAARLPPGEYLYHGHKVVSAGQGVRYADTGILMGSDRTLPEVLEHWTGACGADLSAGIKAATLTPRLALAEARGVVGAVPVQDQTAPVRGQQAGLSRSDQLNSTQFKWPGPVRGAIAPGFQADLAIWERPFSQLRQLVPGAG
jgi:N-acetylglucosamine-6-phosphate deacetylase